MFEGEEEEKSGEKGEQRREKVTKGKDKKETKKGAASATKPNFRDIPRGEGTTERRSWTRCTIL